jgi:hypothetical protein
MRWSAAQALAWIIRQTPLELKEWTSEMGPEIEPAGKKLAKAIGADQVCAWGRPKPHALTEKIPSDQFRIPGLTLIVSPYADLATSPRHKLSTYEGRQWHGIEFDVGEIKRAFPKPPSSSAMEWMHEAAKRHAAAGIIGKRDVMVRDCMKATGRTKREAEAAHKSLPDKLKRPRGKPRKNPG